MAAGHLSENFCSKCSFKTIEDNLENVNYQQFSKLNTEHDITRTTRKEICDTTKKLLEQNV